VETVGKGVAGRLVADKIFTASDCPSGGQEIGSRLEINITKITHKSVPLVAQTDKQKVVAEGGNDLLPGKGEPLPPASPVDDDTVWKRKRIGGAQPGAGNTIRERTHLR
jgi:hypothetical protein